MPQSSKVGQQGESLATRYLQNKGYKLLLRNYRAKFGEIDIIARDKQEVLVFIEVKTLSSGPSYGLGFLPEDNLSRWKLHKLQRICQFFANAHPDLCEANGWRIDLLAITLGSGTYKIKHYKNL